MAFSPPLVAKVFICVALLEVLLTAILIVVNLKRMLPATPEHYEDVVFSVVLMVNAVFFAYHAVVGVVKERREDLFAFLVAAVLLTTYEVYQFADAWIHNGSFYGLHTLDYVRFFCVVILSGPSIVLACLSQTKFGWHDFKVVGSDVNLLRCYRDYHRFNALNIIDLQLNLSLVAFAGTAYTIMPEEQLFGTVEVLMYCIYAFLCFFWAALGYMAIRRESKPMIVAFMFLAPFAPAYIIYCTFVYVLDDDYADYTSLTYPLIGIGVLAMLARVLLVTGAIICKNNFGLGLKQRVFDPPTGERQPLVVNV